MEPSRAVQAGAITLHAMLSGFKLLLAIAVFIVLALAVAIHLFGPDLGRMIHGG